MLNDIETEILRLWEQNIPARQIGAALGITKNAVIGRVNRMRKKGVDIDVRVMPKTSIVKIPAAEPIEEELEPLNQIGISVFQLTNKTCKFVVDGEHPRYFRFCGDPVTTKSYCKTHHAICYVKVQPKRYRYTDTVFVLKDRA